MLNALIDRELNYGRAQLDRFFASFSNVGSALDIGVGAGEDLLRLAQKHPHARLLGIDFNGGNLERVASRGIEPLRLDIEREPIPLADESTDVVIANQVFEHLKEAFWCMHECCRVLTVGGHLVFGVPNMASFHNRLLLLAGRQPTCIRVVGPHVRGFTKGGVRQLVTEVAGDSLREEAFEGANFYPLPAVLAKPAARLMPGLSASIFFSFRKVGPYRAEFVERIKREPFETNFFVGEARGEPARSQPISDGRTASAVS